MNLTQPISVEGLVPILALLSQLLFLGGCTDVSSPPDTQSTPTTELDTPNVDAANSHSPSHEGIALLKKSYRFSLRTLLISTTVIAAILGVVAYAIK
jgi:hypothetical protein